VVEWWFTVNLFVLRVAPDVATPFLRQLLAWSLAE
jgi:hypothetical protein